ncbi:MAG TPA: HAD hydrolase-like protein [Verrucomicrobiae bacterium]|nr:HAD hydrolase-like protein [Verrucomicrobiae bacterium]
MQTIEALLLEPVGCLAEFPSAPFHEIAVRLFGRKRKAGSSASQAYWYLLNLIDASKTPFDAEKQSVAEELEVEAVDAASIYEDVEPAVTELKSMGIRLFVASSLSRRAAMRFIERNALGEYFSGVCTRDDAGGVKSTPILNVLASASLPREKTMFLTDTVEGIKVARSVGVNPILMMNDPDEAQRLAMHNPAGGVVSLHEMPDFIRLIAAQNQRS